MNPPYRLNQKNLSQLPVDLRVPSYDRSQVRAGIMHIGVGGFHRSHQAVYTDELLARPGNLAWGICGVGLRDGDRKIADVLRRQDFLYTLIVRHPDGKIENRVIGSLVDFMLGCDDPGAVIERMASEETRIVSLTITEGGYNFDSATGEFNFGNRDVIHDLSHPTAPRTVFGYLTEALRRRRAVGLAPFTVQSCDNIQHNGAVTREMVLAFAGRQDPDLAAWMEKEVSFPNAMVDRITPVTTPEDIEYLEDEVGVKDEWPVTCEPFTQWVIEDDFCCGRPDWQEVGTQFVPDVTPYEKMKIRLLNAGHSVLGILGSLHGHHTIDGAVGDPLFEAYLRRFMDSEATPVLDTVAGIDLDAYKDSLLERFSNPNIKDKLSRICLESSAKLPKFLIPTIRENLATGGSIEYATLVLAAWCYYSAKGQDRHGKALEISDGLKNELHEAAARTPQDPVAFLKVEAVFGDLRKNATFTAVYTRMVGEIFENPNISQHMQAILFGRD
ncbi:mannitol dehydrogenase family protein [Roseibacillus ishigakijimensis]|uniref:Mannitol dehydrogenase family protein n=1 Tax=Roseibacillus ishigakijimensis TaxID=454146 RepID=A0A934VLG2_9BACT|nr:mannitol dehydrogenase family protein [Roseibacillus ishigakijimensis]MBK1833207.1 mannitol dehydrogenase family protein [Roseibacillus ishigakijimensis]